MQNGCMVSFDKNDKFLMARQNMIKNHIAARGVKDQRVLDVIGQIPREEFVSVDYQNHAYDDNPLPIGLGQTISQPYIVALMTEHLNIDKDDEVLEIGTGCGYQTAILAKLCKRVYTIERMNQLQESAQAALGRLRIENVEFYTGDGTKGWHQDREFDRIIVTAAADEIPKPLIDQLKIGGKIVIPIGGTFSQNLVCGTKKEDRSIEIKNICPVRFVRLIGEYGYDDE